MKKFEYILKKLEDDLYMNAPYGYLSITPEGIIKKVNNLILSWAGYKSEEILNKKIDLIFTKESSGKLESEQPRDGVYTLLSKKGDTISVFLNVVNLKGNKDNTIVIRITLEDDHARKMSPEGMYHPGSSFQPHKKRYVSSSVTHEIQTPLSIIKGTIDLLDDTSLTQQQKEYLDILKNSSEVLRAVMTDVIDFNGLDNSILKKDEIQIQSFVNGIFKMHSVIALKKNLDLKLIIDDGMPETVYGDKTKIAQVLLNLLSNAVKFTDQGTVILEVYQKNISTADVTLLFTVTDTGIGIEKNEIDLIFNEFTQANDRIQQKYGGLGLGLSICKKILAVYGSELKVKSSPLGSTFSFLLTLPIGRTDKKTDTILQENKFRDNITVLIADDNETSALIVSHYLKKMGLRYEIVPDGEAAYQKVLKGGFDLILMDLQMPVTSGIIASKKIRSIEDSKLKNIPIIAFSADNVLTKTQLNDIGINDFLLKPFDFEELIKIIISYLPQSKIDSHQTTAAEQPVNLESLLKLTSGNPEEFNILIKKSIEEFQEGKMAFTKGFNENDIVKIKAVAHKLKSQIHYVKAFRLQSKINEALETLNNQGKSAKTPAILLSEILSEMDISIAAIREFQM